MLAEGRKQYELERKLELLAESSTTLLGSLEAGTVLPAILRLARRINPADAYAIWRLNPAKSLWEIAAAEGLSEGYQEFTVKHGTSSPPGEPPYRFENLEHEFLGNRRGLYRKEGIRSLVAMPMTIGTRPCGTLVFYYREAHRFSPTEMRVISALAHVAGAAIETSELHQEHQRHRAEAERARIRASFLAEASAVLASSLDYETTLVAVARLAVPRISDWCSVEIAQEDGTLKQLVMVHMDPAKTELAKELRRKYPLDPKAHSGPQRVLRTAKPDIWSEVTERRMKRAVGTPEDLERLRALGLKAFMCVPLAARDRVLGVLTFISAESGRAFGSEELALAEDLARSAAIAIDNALLYAAAQRERAALATALTALRENDERLRMALDAGRMGIWDWNIQTNELNWSDNLIRMHGLDPATFDRRIETYLAMIHPDDRPAFDAAVERALTQRSYFEVESRVIHRDGSIHWVTGKGKTLCNENGEPVHLLGLCMETTERRRLEEKLQASQKLESIGLLAGGIAHDFNNLLTGIMGNASLALEVLTPSNEAAPLIDNVVRASERAADLTRQLLAYSGKGRFVIQPVDLSALVRDISSLIQSMIPKIVRLEFELQDGLPAIEADYSQIQQVVMNLVINGAEAMGERSGRVLVRTGLLAADEPYLRRHFAREEL
jgi:PAS domain S-box-containing protein